MLVNVSNRFFDKSNIYIFQCPFICHLLYLLTRKESGRLLHISFFLLLFFFFFFNIKSWKSAEKTLLCIVPADVSASCSDWLHPNVRYRGMMGNNAKFFSILAGVATSSKWGAAISMSWVVASTLAGALARTRAPRADASCVFLLAASRTDQDVRTVAICLSH